MTISEVARLVGGAPRQLAEAPLRRTVRPAPGPRERVLDGTRGVRP